MDSGEGVSAGRLLTYSRFSRVCAAFGFAVHTDYFFVAVRFNQFCMIHFRKMLHSVGHSLIVDTMLDAAEGRFGWHSVFQHAYFANLLILCLPNSINYTGTPCMSAGASKYHQHDDVGESVADVSFVRPAEIGD